MGRLQIQRRSKITVPERCHPLAKIIFAEMGRQSVTYDEIEFRSGVLRSTVKAWRKNNRPGIETIEAALGALGWKLVAVPNDDQVPDDITIAVIENTPALSATAALMRKVANGEHAS